MKIIGVKIGENAARQNADLKEMRKYLACNIERFSKQTKLVLSLYYVEKLTFNEIGIVLNLSEAKVLQIHLQAIKLLRALLRKELFAKDS